jgi:hypothetical protein
MDCRRDVCVANMRGVRDVRPCATKMGLESGAGQVFDAPGSVPWMTLLYPALELCSSVVFGFGK